MMFRPSRWVTSSLLAGVLTLTACGGSPERQDWAYFGGDKAFTRYAPLEQIDRDNVGDVQILWQRPALDASYVEAYPDLVDSDQRPGRRNNLKSTPIFIDGVLYAPNSVGLVEAFDPGSGETVWVQEPFAPTLAEVAGSSSRGLDYWTDGTDRRLILVKGGYLYNPRPGDRQHESRFRRWREGEPRSAAGRAVQLELGPHRSRGCRGYRRHLRWSRRLGQ